MASKDIAWNGTDQQIGNALLPFGLRVTAREISQIRDYVRLILKWNRFTSLTSITDPVEILARHFGESVFLRSVLPVENGRLADVGSGAGFPGLALKLVCPQLKVILIESNKKKAAFLSEVIRSLDLSGVEVMPERFEDIRLAPTAGDLITARAVGNFEDILKWSRLTLSSSGHLVLWTGGEDTAIISNTAGWTWKPAVKLPDSQRRFILVGSPIVP